MDASLATASSTVTASPTKSGGYVQAMPAPEVQHVFRDSAHVTEPDESARSCACCGDDHLDFARKYMEVSKRVVFFPFKECFVSIRISGEP